MYRGVTDEAVEQQKRKETLRHAYEDLNRRVPYMERMLRESQKEQAEILEGIAEEINQVMILLNRILMDETK